MKTSKKYTFDGRVRFSEVDHKRQITLPAIINYFQDCSTFQSESIGYGVDRLIEEGHAWILSYWQVVIDRYPKMGEHIQTSTWANSFKGMLGNRNFAMVDEQGEMVAYANSIWVYMDMEKGRPSKPSAEEMEAYGTAEPLDMNYEPRKITLPENVETFPSLTVKKWHIDTNEHVNNCQYVQMALEVLDIEREIRQLRVEYKKSAVYNDIIVPKVSTGEERTIVELCGPEGDIYAVTEFMWA